MLRTVLVLFANDRGTLLPTSKKRSRTSSFLSFFLSFPLVLDPEMMAPSGLPLLLPSLPFFIVDDVTEGAGGLRIADISEENIFTLA